MNSKKRLEKEYEKKQERMLVILSVLVGFTILGHYLIHGHL